MFCENCGKEIGDNDAFCPNCGKAMKEKKIMQEEKTLTESDVKSENTNTEPKKKKSGKAIVVLGIVAIVIIVSVFAMKMFGGNSKAKEIVEKLKSSTTVSKTENRYEFKHDNAWSLCYTEESMFVIMQNSVLSEYFEGVLEISDLGDDGTVRYNLGNENMNVYCDAEFEGEDLSVITYDVKKDEVTFIVDGERYELKKGYAKQFKDDDISSVLKDDIKSFEDDLKKMDLTKDDVANLTYKDIKANVDDKELKILDQEEPKPQSKNETVQKETTESSTDKSLGWKKAYLDYLNKIENTEYGYSLEYIDGDDVPELVIDYKIAAKGISLCTYDGSKVVETPVGEFLRYKLKENSFCVSGGRMDYYYDIIYKIVDGVPQEVAKGEYGILDPDNKKYDEAGDIIYQYLWNGKSVSEYDYSDFTQPFNFEDNTDVVCSAGSGYFYDIIKVLEHPLDIVTISPYLNDNGYDSLLNNCKVLFDGIEGDKIHFSVTYEGELVGSASATIIDSKTAEYKNPKCELKIKFNEDCKKLEIEGHMDTIDLTGSYVGAWG